MAIPDLDLVIGYTAGNYGAAAAGIPRGVYVPQFMLPAAQQLFYPGPHHRPFTAGA